MSLKKENLINDLENKMCLKKTFNFFILFFFLLGSTHFTCLHRSLIHSHKSFIWNFVVSPRIFVLLCASTSACIYKHMYAVIYLSLCL